MPGTDLRGSPEVVVSGIILRQDSTDSLIDAFDTLGFDCLEVGSSVTEMHYRRGLCPTRAGIRFPALTRPQRSTDTEVK